MTYSYSGTPNNSNVDRLRFEISDTGLAGTAGGTVWMFTDPELTFVVSVETTWDGRVAHACETLARQWARIPSFTADGLRVDKGQVAKAYAERAKELRASTGHVQYGEINVIRKDGYSDDIDATEADAASETSITWDNVRYRKGFPLTFDA